MAFFRFRQQEFSYAERGSGLAVLFLHGFLESKEMWGSLVDSLPKNYRKIALDLPGHGESGNLGYVHSMEEMAELVLALLKELKLRKVVLVGHSMGAYVALAFAEKYPDKVKALVLQNSTARADSEQRKANRDRAIALVKKRPSTYVRQAIPLLFRPKNRKLFQEEVKEVKTLALKTSAQGIVAALEGMKLRLDREVLLHFSPYPVLVIAGKHDPIIAVEDIKDQCQGSKAQLVVLEDGHMSHIEQFDALRKTLASFLRTL